MCGALGLGLMFFLFLVLDIWSLDCVFRTYVSWTRRSCLCLSFLFFCPRCMGIMLLGGGPTNNYGLQHASHLQWSGAVK